MTDTTLLRPPLHPDRLAVHIGNAAPQSALDGFTEPKRWPWKLLFVASVPTIGAAVCAAEWLRYLL